MPPKHMCEYVCIYIYMCVCVFFLVCVSVSVRVCACVCVTHLNRCKTSAFVGSFFITTAGGCRECHSSAANENGYDIL